MKKLQLNYRLLAISALSIMLFILLGMNQVSAVTYLDNTDAEFQLGNTSEVNSTSNTIILNLTNATDFYASGTYTSRVFELGSNPASTISWNFTTPAGTSILVSTRSGDSTDTSSGWSAWSSNYATSTGSTVTSPTERYLQYRVQLATTDTTATPTLESVAIVYTEQNTSFTAGANDDLNSNYSGDYEWTTEVADTFTIINVTGSYRINSSGSWSTAVNLTPSGSDYPFTIDEPGSGWDSLTNSTLYINIVATVTNGSVESVNNYTFSEYIDFLNTPAVIDPISNQTVLQEVEVIVTITASDADGHSLTFTSNRTGATVTSLTSTSARFNWTPNGSHVGTHAITITADDGYDTSTRTFYVTVDDVNDAPELAPVSAITGYYGITQFIELVAVDLDFYQNLTFSMIPNFFNIQSSNTPLNSSTPTPGTWYGWANFTPLDPEKGYNIVNFQVSDGEVTTRINTTMNITYCGDNICQSTYENATSCAVDCAEEVILPGIALIAPDRNCVFEPMVLRSFNAQNRFSCYYEGRVEAGLALCEPLDSVSITSYLMNGSLFLPRTSLTTSTNGEATFTPTSEGTYRFFATKDGYKNTSISVTVRTCAQDIVIEEQNYTVEQPPLPPSRPRIPIDIEEPGITEEERSWLFIFFIYFLSPILMATMMYFGSVFYDVNKDTLPWLLRMRIWGYEQRAKLAPQIEWVKEKSAPVIRPVIESLKALYESLIAPIVEKLKNLRRKP